ncbi:hypothetical protein L484_018517 [Morus notabilis]|uniref:Uncharacterized protein n=1 Tax=Morus notabilis TaxID=981085 RepID=W9S3Q0_9ROSA|nr:hypothetical protein L484_018517 [Morus notabilis]
MAILPGPGPGMGHLISLLEFAKRLISHHRFHVTCIIPTIGPPSATLKQVLNDDYTNPNDSKLNVVYLPPVNFHGLTAVKAETQIFLAITRSLSPLREVLKSLKAIVDGFGTDAFDIAEEFRHCRGIKSFLVYFHYVFCHDFVV